MSWWLVYLRVAVALWGMQPGDWKEIGEGQIRMTFQTNGTSERELGPVVHVRMAAPMLCGPMCREAFSLLLTREW